MRFAYRQNAIQGGIQSLARGAPLSTTTGVNPTTFVVDSQAIKIFAQAGRFSYPDFNVLRERSEVVRGYRCSIAKQIIFELLANRVPAKADF